MTDISSFNQIKELIENSQNIGLFTATNAAKDVVLAGLALEKALMQKGKNVSFYSASSAVSQVGFIEEAKDIKTKLAPQSFIISLAYKKDDIEKVGYDTAHDKFNLIITPKKGRIDPSRISFSTDNLGFDLIFILDVSNLESIGDSFTENQEEFSEKTVVSLHTRSFVGPQNAIDVNDTAKGTLSELLVSLFDVLQVEYNEELTTLLLTGIYAGTDSFRAKNVSAETFSCVNTLVQKGAHIQKTLRYLYAQTGVSTADRGSTEKATDQKIVEEPPTPFVKPQKNPVEIDEPPVFNQGTQSF